MRGLTRLALRRRLRRRADAAALEPAQRRRRAALVLHARRRASAPALVDGPMVWGICPETPGTGLGALTLRDAPRRPRRPAGRRQRRGDRGARAARSRPPAAMLRTDAPVDGDPCATATACAGSTLADGTEITAPVVVSACEPATHVRRWLREPAGRRAADRRRWRAAPSTPKATSRRSTPCVDRVPPRCAAATDPLGVDAR